MKFLGRIIDFSLKDGNAVETFISTVLSGLNLIEKSSHTGVHKVWILHHLFVPRLRWPLLIYEISISVVIKLEQKISSFLRKWLKIHPSTTNICLYSSSSPCPLPLKSLTSILKSAKVSGHLLLRDSTDPNITESTSHLKCGFWDVSEAVIDAESRLEFQKVIGYHQTSRAGFGSFHRPAIPSKNSKEYRKLISDLVNESDQNAYHAKSVQLHLQGYWTQWCSFIKNDFSWKALLSMPAQLVSFSLGAVFNTLPSPNNLKRWNLTTESSCCLCGKEVCTLPHILGGCKIALTQNRYTFRHDSVLRELSVILKDFLSSYKPSKGFDCNDIHFVKEGQRCQKSSKKKYLGIFHSASDWKLRFDLDDGLVIPSSLAISSLRPDILIFSPSSRKVIIIELTCPCEENMGDWHEEKSQKYYPLCTSIRSNGWSVYFFAIEVGARGFCAESVRSCLRRLGFANKLCNKSLKSLSSVSLKCSFEIWLSRNSKSWSLDNSVPTSSSTPIKEKVQVVKDPPTNSFTVKSAKHPINSAKYSSSLKKVNRCGIINKGNTC